MVDPRGDPIELVPAQYDEWRAQFERERTRVNEALERTDLGHAVERIEHVGSTAVPGLDAKDIVDLDVVVTDGEVETVAEAIERELGGTVDDNGPEWHPVYREHDGQRFNDHVFAASADGWKVSVATRAALRARDDLRRDYEERKRELTTETDGLVTYSRGKTDLLQDVLDVARGSDDPTVSFTVPTLDE